jgi:hypothetical protein
VAEAFGNAWAKAGYFDEAITWYQRARVSPDGTASLAAIEQLANLMVRRAFALAGMNAHINRDLPQGIVAAYRGTDGAPAQGSARHEAFDKVNDLLEAVEAQIRPEFSTGLVLIVDVACGDKDNAIAMWKVRAARATAWTNAEVLWALRSTPALSDAFFSRLDSLTGFAGRGLLVPTVLGTNSKRGVYADG